MDEEAILDQYLDKITNHPRWPRQYVFHLQRHPTKKTIPHVLEEGDEASNAARVLRKVFDTFTNPEQEAILSRIDHYQFLRTDLKPVSWVQCDLCREYEVVSDETRKIADASSSSWQCWHCGKKKSREDEFSLENGDDWFGFFSFDENEIRFLEEFAAVEKRQETRAAHVDV